MSSSTIIYSLKRRSDEELCSNDSEEDAPPAKKPCLLNGEPNAVQRKLKKILVWFTRLPISFSFLEGFVTTTLDGRFSTDPVNEEEVIEVVDTEDDDPIVETELTCSSDMSTKRGGFRRNSAPVHPLSSSTPVCRGQNGNRGVSLSSLSSQIVNGYSGLQTNPTRNKKDRTIPTKTRYNRNVAPISNPSLDVEILLDTRETPCEESDDLEIVSEIPNSEPSKRLTRQTVSPLVISKLGRTSKECNGTSLDSIVNAEAASCEGQEFNRSFTAHDVFRHQEKETYKQLLNKMVGTNKYYSFTPTRTPKPAETIDLTGDKEPVTPNRVRKENLETPVNEFLQQHFISVNFTPIAPKNNSEVEILTLDDDDVQVSETNSSDDFPAYIPKFNRGSGLFDESWITDLKNIVTFKTDEYMKDIAQQQAALERFKKRRAERISKGKILRGVSTSSDKGPNEFPELSEAMYERIKEAFGNGLGTETLSTFKDCICNRSDMVTLSGLNWLNDSVINFYLALIVERAKNHPVYPSVYTFNSYFYSSLKSRGPKAVMRWTRKIEDSKNIFQFDILFVPLHLGMHWALCVVDNRTKKIKYYDSMHGTDEQCLRTLQNYLVVEKKEKLGIVMDPSEYSLEHVKDIPQQMNGSDCGMFTLKYADYISRDAPITFSQENMQYFRHRMVIEILDKKLFPIS